MNKIFKSKRGIRGLVMLVVGFFLLANMGLFLFHYYNTVSRNNISWSQARRDIIAWTVMAKRLNNEPLRNLISQENRSWLRMTVEPNPLPNAVVFSNDYNIWDIQQALGSEENKPIILSIALQKHGYLNIRGRKPDRILDFYGLAFSLGVLLCLLFLLCYFVIQYISVPLYPLMRAVQRFAYDIKSPALEETGTEEMRAVIRAFNTMQKNIRQLLDDRTQMLAAISHDLRTPITRLKLRAENIEDEKNREKILLDLNEMEQMIASILAFAREQNADEAKQTFDLNSLLQSICDDLTDRGKSVTYHTQTQRLKYFGRLIGLKRALDNIIDNAIKYGGSCEVTLQHDDTQINIIVRDKGTGIPEDKMEQVFKPFYRLDSARSPSKPGTGLGLAIAKEIITAHGGNIQLKNLHQEGSVSGFGVIVHLPSIPTL